jgi:hypothetical protein
MRVAVTKICPDTCVSEFNKKCELVTRTLVPPRFGQTKATETFITFDIAGYKISTVEGTRRFSGVAIDKNTTHLFMTRFRPKIEKLDGAGEHFMRRNGKYFRIVRITNIDEHNKYLLFQCRERGLDTEEETNA